MGETLSKNLKNKINQKNKAHNKDKSKEEKNKNLIHQNNQKNNIQTKENKENPHSNSENGNIKDNNKSNSKPVNVSLSNIKCKYCNKNFIPNKVLRSHLFYCVDCYIKKKNLKYQADLNYHTELEFTEIIQGKLYLGNNEAAKNKEILIKNNITSILICGYFLSEFFPNEYIYKTLEFEDNEHELITFALVKGIDFIDKNKCILVHCRKGISRSSSVVIAFIMFHYKKNFDEAFNFVLKKKNNIQPNENFIQQLKNFDEMIKVCNYDKKMIKEFCLNFTNKHGHDNMDMPENNNEVKYEN